MRHGRGGTRNEEAQIRWWYIESRGSNERDGNTAGGGPQHLEVGPRHDVIARSCGGIQRDGHAETGCPHRTLRAEPLHGLHEAPRGNGSELDLAGLEDAIASDNAPAIFEGVYNCW